MRDSIQLINVGDILYILRTSGCRLGPIGAIEKRDSVKESAKKMR